MLNVFLSKASVSICVTQTNPRANKAIIMHVDVPSERRVQSFDVQFHAINYHGKYALSNNLWNSHENNYNRTPKKWINFSRM